MSLGQMMMMRGASGGKKINPPRYQEKKEPEQQPMPKPHAGFSTGSLVLGLIFAAAIFFATKNIVIAIVFAGMMLYLSHKGT